MKAKGSCGLQEAGKEVTLPLLSLPRLGSVCMTGGVPGCAGFSLPAASAQRHVVSDTPGKELGAKDLTTLRIIDPAQVACLRLPVHRGATISTTVSVMVQGKCVAHCRSRSADLISSVLISLTQQSKIQ